MSYISSCSICTFDFVVNDKLTTLQCGHAYHSPCILQWLADHSTCPCCRQDVSSWDSTFSMKISGFYDAEEAAPSIENLDEILRLKEIIKRQDMELKHLKNYADKCHRAEERLHCANKELTNLRDFVSGNKNPYVRKVNGINNRNSFFSSSKRVKRNRRINSSFRWQNVQRAKRLV